MRRRHETLECTEITVARLAHDIACPQRRQDAVLPAELGVVHITNNMGGRAEYAHEESNQRIVAIPLRLAFRLRDTFLSPRVVFLRPYFVLWRR